jgi:hypothetical protein
MRIRTARSAKPWREIEVVAEQARRESLQAAARVRVQLEALRVGRLERPR